MWSLIGGYHVEGAAQLGAAAIPFPQKDRVRSDHQAEASRFLCQFVCSIITMSASTAHNDVQKKEQQEEEVLPHLPLSAALVISQLELPDLTTRMVHESTNNRLDTHFPVVPERMMGNSIGRRTGNHGNLQIRNDDDDPQNKTDRILKEIQNLKRQNLITHCLLGAMIVLTLGWQLSEVSLILALKDGLTHPFRTIGKTVSRMVKRRGLKDSENATEEESLPPLPIGPPPILALRMPELPNFLDPSQWGLKGNGC
uniref:Uncharacterized protein n=1 Tax=Kalanchoe fedtschenkoi TaxID=63787 RepID=A0A7N0RBV8_KALFE